MPAGEFAALNPGDLQEHVDAWKRRERRADFRAAKVCEVLAECNRDRDVRAFPFEVSDFFPSLAEVAPEKTDEALWAKLNAAVGTKG